MIPPNRLAPAVAPLEPGGARPLWSVMVPTHDCADYLRHTLASVLAQDPGPDEMQIEVVDDASTRDDPARVVEELGRGRVALHRHPRNVGAIASFNACLARARGEWVHVLHADDLVRPGFYAVLAAGTAGHPELGAAFCRGTIIDEHDREVEVFAPERNGSGVLEDFITRIGVVCSILTPTIVVRRAVYETLGGFDPRLVHAADWEMWQRIAVHYPVWYEAQPLALYRRHSDSDTSRLVQTGANIADIRRAIDVAHGYVPAAVADDVRRRALAFYGEAALWTAKRLRDADAMTAVAQMRQAAHCYWHAGRRAFALRVWASALKLRLRGGARVRGATRPQAGSHPGTSASG